MVCRAGEACWAGSVLGQTSKSKFLTDTLMTRREDAMVWFSAIEEKNYSKIIELAAVFQGSRDKYGDTGLMLAARQGDTKVIQILLPYEAGLANDDNQTALIVAALCDKAKRVGSL